jgi:enamine deaminase RidA (YjgF/YER057c/UK114 family)
MLTTLRTDTALGYSQAVRAGNLLFVSGQVAVDERGQVVGGGDIRAHVDRVFRNVRAVVEAGGSRLDLVTKLTIFTTSMDYLPAIREARRETFGASGAYPASTLVQVSGLARPEFLVEVEATAVVPEPAAPAGRSRSRARRPASARRATRGRSAASGPSRRHATAAA